MTSVKPNGPARQDAGLVLVPNLPAFRGQKHSPSIFFFHCKEAEFPTGEIL
jgi:hypothetical protein